MGTVLTIERERYMLRLGIIGFSEGNGHPYSWSAIFNGYQKEMMEHCGFPVIPRYLELQKWPDAQIGTARVTHIWTQDIELSRKIAATTYIEHVVNAPEDMIGEVDAILLARDDAESHFKLASPFINAGIPIYIDKPIALSTQSLDAIYNLERYPGQIFTCSAFRYSPDFILSEDDKKQLGQIVELYAFSPKSWDKYAIHIIEPVLKLLNEQSEIVELIKHKGNNGGSGLTVQWASGVKAHIFVTGQETAAPFNLRLLGHNGWKDLFFQNSFIAFKAALIDFIEGITESTVKSSPDFNRQVISLVEAGRA